MNTYVMTKFDKTITLCGLYHEIRVFACPGRGSDPEIWWGRAVH